MGQMILDVFKEVLTSFGSILIIIAVSFAIYGLNLLCTKMGITINANSYDEIVNIIKKVIKYLDQKYVDTIKKNSEDGTLTEYQQKLIKEKAMNLVKDMLSAEQVQILLDKYNMSNIDDIIDILIDATIKDARDENISSLTASELYSSEKIDAPSKLESDSEDEISSKCVAKTILEDEKVAESLKVCDGNCTKCGLHTECKYSRF